MLPHIILASGSPRRRELLSMLGVRDFDICPADTEIDFPTAVHPGDAAVTVALGKAESVLSKAEPSSLILAADTVVSLDGKILEKPADKNEAFEMLTSLSGRRHTVYTGVAILYGGKKICRYESAEVYFRSISPEEIRRYIASGEPMDKAGAYGAQGIGAVFIEKIDGDFFNVVGLPLCTLGKMLSELGVEII